AVTEHRMDGVEALPSAALWTVALEWNAQGKDFAHCNELTRLRNFLRGDVVQRPNFIIRAPFAPVAHLQCQFPQGLLVAHRPSFPLLALWCLTLLGFPRDRITQHADVADLDLNRIASVHRADAFAGTGVDDVAWIQRHMLADKTDACRHIKN